MDQFGALAVSHVSLILRKSHTDTGVSETWLRDSEVHGRSSVPA